MATDTKNLIARINLISQSRFERPLRIFAKRHHLICVQLSQHLAKVIRSLLVKYLDSIASGMKPKRRTKSWHSGLADGPSQNRNPICQIFNVKNMVDEAAEKRFVQSEQTNLEKRLGCRSESIHFEQRISKSVLRDFV